MSNDDTPREPTTRELVLQVLERLARVEEAVGISEGETQPLAGRVGRLVAEVADLKAEMREGFADVDRELTRLNRQDAGHYLRLEERVRALEHPEETKP